MAACFDDQQHVGCIVLFIAMCLFLHARILYLFPYLWIIVYFQPTVWLCTFHPTTRHFITVMSSQGRHRPRPYDIGDWLPIVSSLTSDNTGTTMSTTWTSYGQQIQLPGTNFKSLLYCRATAKANWPPKHQSWASGFLLQQMDIWSCAASDFGYIGKWPYVGLPPAWGIIFFAHSCS